MKTKYLIQLLIRNGWTFKRHGANHDIYVKDGERESIVRHRETDEVLKQAPDSLVTLVDVDFKELSDRPY